MEYEPSDLQFYGHETFPLRHMWLPKAVNHAREHGNLLDYNKVMEEQGVGKNMAKSMRHWAESTQVLYKDKTTKEHKITKIGKVIFSQSGDKYLQHTDTLWLLHYLLVSNHKKNALWYYLFNIYGGVIFSKESFTTNLKSWLEKIEHRIPNIKQLERDFNCCMNMYCLTERKAKKDFDEYFSSPFIDLQLISQNENNYRLRKISTKVFSNELFTYCLLSYLENFNQKSTIPFSEIFHGEKSPGKVFNLTENLLLDYLEAFVKLNDIEFEFDSTAGIKTLFRIGKFSLNKESFLLKAYKNAY